MMKFDKELLDKLFGTWCERIYRCSHYADNESGYILYPEFVNSDSYQDIYIRVKHNIDAFMKSNASILGVDTCINSALYAPWGILGKAYYISSSVRILADRSISIPEGLCIKTENDIEYELPLLRLPLLLKELGPDISGVSFIQWIAPSDSELFEVFKVIDLDNKYSA